MLTSLSAPNVGGAVAVAIAMPNDAAIVGAQLAAQSLCLTLGNPANLLTSNGVAGTVGY